MSMPGFVFYFQCDSCNTKSGSYSVYVFHNLFSPNISLPAWSLAHKYWGSVSADLSVEQRRAMESDRELLLSFAASLTSDNLTVGVPQLSTGQSDSFYVELTPEPRCPYCGVTCRSVLGYPSLEESSSNALVSLAEFRAAPLSLIGLSVRTKMICRDLGLDTIGELEDGRSRFAAHPRATDIAVQEIDSLLLRKPVCDA